MNGMWSRALHVGAPLLAALVLAMSATPAACAQSSAKQRKQEFATERRAIQAKYQARVSECREHFVVTTCMDEARAERRKALAAVRDREVAIDEAERAERAAARQKRIDEKIRRRQAAPDAPASDALMPPLGLGDEKKK